ncbi:MAG: carboxypeptidase regulatory-like domain-containing protein [Candidatus Dormibacteria bacterium]
MRRIGQLRGRAAMVALGCASGIFLSALMGATQIGFSVGLGAHIRLDTGLPLSASYAADPYTVAQAPLSADVGRQVLIDSGASSDTVVADATVTAPSPVPSTVPPAPEQPEKSPRPAPSPSSAPPPPQQTPPIKQPSAQLGAIWGHVYSISTGQPISGATVTIAGGDSAVTDSYGYYRIAGTLPSHTYQLECVAAGYVPGSAQLTTNSAGNGVQQFQMVQYQVN